MDVASVEIHQIAWAIAGFCTAASVFISFRMIWNHLRNYTEPRVQIYILRIILMIPIYVIDSYLSLLFKDVALYFDFARDCYEAYVLFMFFRLLVELADGEEAMIQKMEPLPQIRYSLPLCCFHIKPGRIFMHRCKQMILQYVLFKPLLAVSSFVLQLVGEYHEGDYSPSGGYLYISVTYNVSITISLYFLVLFYEATKEIIKPFKPLSKFLCIKAIIFFSFWQSVVIAGMVDFNILIEERGDWTIDEVARGAQAFLICCEMLPLSIAFMRTFGHETFKDPLAQNYFFNNSRVFSNFATVANVKDLVNDTVVSLKKGPKRNVAVEDFLDVPRDQQLKRVVKQGWIAKRGEDMVKIWKNRYFLIINKPKGLVYFKANPFGPDRRLIEDNAGKLKARGFLDLSPQGQVTEVIAIKANNFAIVTPARRWKFKCNSSRERDEWIEAIFQVFPELKEGPRTLPTSPTSTVTSPQTASSTPTRNSIVTIPVSPSGYDPSLPPPLPVRGSYDPNLPPGVRVGLELV